MSGGGAAAPKGKKPFVYVRTLGGEVGVVGKDAALVCLVSDPEASVEFVYEGGRANVQVAENPEDSRMKVLTIKEFSADNAGKIWSFGSSMGIEGNIKFVLWALRGVLALFDKLMITSRIFR